MIIGISQLQIQIIILIFSRHDKNQNNRSACAYIITMYFYIGIAEVAKDYIHYTTLIKYSSKKVTVMLNN